MIGFDALEDGRARLHGRAAELCRWFDGKFLRMALDAGAIECRFPSTIARDTLARAGYFEAFPDNATALGPRDGAGDYLLCPAVCYHAYAWLENRQLDAPVRLTAVQTCFREADRLAGAPSRLWEFTMREMIFVGEADWVVSQTGEWAERIAVFAASVGLRATLEPATDPFFGDAGRGRRLFQQVKGLKVELRAAYGGDTVAVASFNRHETFFSSRFGLELPGGGTAHSACVACGLERWALAFLDQRGPDAAAALESAADE